MKPIVKSLFPTCNIRVQVSALPLLAFAASLILGASSAEAQLTWNSSGITNNWSTASGNENWLPGNVVWSQNSDAVFDVASGTPESINATTTNVFNDITFNVSGFTIASAGAGSLVLGNDTASTISVTNLADSASVNETIANNGGVPSTLTKAGLGTLTLAGTANSNFSGGTIISAGKLIASHEGSLGTGPVTNNATLDINKANVTFNGLSVSMSGNGAANVTALGTGTNSLILNGDYSGFTGNWNIGVGAPINAGKVQMNGLDNAASTITILSNATVFAATGTHNAAVVLKGGDTGESIGQLRIDGATTVWAGPITLDGVATGAGDGIIGSNSGPATISGLISETGGPRELTKAGGGTIVLTNTNTYSGPTKIFGGKIGTALIGNTGINTPIGSNGSISLGNLGSGGTLLYSGNGEITDRVLNLGGTTGNGVVELSGASGLLKFTSNLTATGAGPKTLVLMGSTAATGEISGQIVDNTGSNATTLATAFIAAANTITLGSVQGLTTGIGISGTGIAGGTTISAINTGTRVVTLSLPTSGAGTAGQVISVNGVTNPTGLSKSSGSGTWTVSGNNTFTGNAEVRTGDLIITNSSALGVGPKTVTVIPSSNPSSLSSLVLDGSGGDITLDSSLSFTSSFDALSGGLLQPIPGEAAIINQVGNNTVAGNFNLTSGGGGTAFLVNSGTLTLTGIFTPTQPGRNLHLRGDANGFISGAINTGTGANTLGVTKDAGSGTWTLSGANGYTGATSVSTGELILAGTASNVSNRIANGGILTIAGDYSGASGTTTVNSGTLRLDYSSVDSGKLGDSSILALAGGTVELKGGSHAEYPLNTTLVVGSNSLITRSSGSATLNLRTVTGSGIVTLAQPSIATTDNSNTNGLLPWARVLVAGVPVVATNSTDSADGPITAYTGFTDVTRLGVSAIPNNPLANVRIINGGTSGNITLTAAPLNEISFLQMAATDGGATVAPTASTDVFSIGDDFGGTIWQSPGAGAFTLGTAANDGILTSGGVDNNAPALITLTNDSANPLVINSAISNNGTDVVSLSIGGTGPVSINGSVNSTGTITTGGSTAVIVDGDIANASTITNSSSGLLTLDGFLGGAANITASGGNIIANGNNSFTGALTAGAARTVTLTGDNSLRPAAVNGRTVISNGGTLQLQANAGNTIAGLSSVLSGETTANQPLTLASGGLLQLRSDSPVTFLGGNNLGGLGTATVSFNVDQLTPAGTGNTLSIAPLGFNVNTTTINVTGGNGYALSLGKINNVTGTAAATMTLNPTTANLNVAGYGGTTNFTSTLNLTGSAPDNHITAAITNANTAAISLTKNGTSTWTVDAANTYTGATTINDGTLKAGNAASFNNLGTLGMTGAGILDLNGFGAAFTNVSASATTNTITDNSAGVGTTSFIISNQSTTVNALVNDGPTKDVRVLLKNANSGTVPFAVNRPNTFSGGLVLQTTATGTRLRISAPPVTVGSPGAIVNGPFGTGPISVGEAATDKAGILLDSLPNFTIVNDIIFNTIAGTDLPFGIGIRLDTTGHIFSGTLTANLSDVLFGNTGAATVTGRVTGPLGFQLSATAVTVRLANSGTANDYLGETTLGANSTLSLGAAEQIPDGAGKGNLNNSGTLNLAGFNETINGLNGAGSLTSSSGSPTLHVGGNNASSTYTGSTTGTLALNKVGSGFLTLAGNIGHQGDTTVTQGTLAVASASTFANGADVRLNTGGTLNLATAGTDVIDQLYINGIGQSAGKWGRPGSIAALGADFETSLISGDGLLSVSVSGGTPFSLWAASKGLDGTPGKENGPNDDPDADGASNLEEFAFDGDPLNGASRGKVVGKIGLVSGSSHMTISLPVRNGGIFTDASGPEISAIVDGVIYRVEGSDTLASWTLDVSEVIGADATTIQTGLPPVSVGWSYRTFRAPFAIGGGNPKDFLRAGAE